MICRMWHGWTTDANADAYEHLLRTEIFFGIRQRKIPGFLDIDLLKRPVPEGVEFATLMWFDSIEAVHCFAGLDYEAAVVPPKAQQLLVRFDQRSAHYRVIGQQSVERPTSSAVST